MADEPYIPADQNLPEFTVKAIVVGVVLAIIMGAANAYLGLKVGMTVSATIPSAVMAMAIFRSIKGNVLEVNLAKTMGSAGESLAAGVIFTIPALIILVLSSLEGGSETLFQDVVAISIQGAMDG